MRDLMLEGYKRTAMRQSIRKASKARMLGDMRRAARLVRAMPDFSRHYSVAYIIGAAEAVQSATMRAALLTAIGG